MAGKEVSTTSKSEEKEGTKKEKMMNATCIMEK